MEQAPDFHSEMKKSTDKQADVNRQRSDDVTHSMGDRAMRAVIDGKSGGVSVEDRTRTSIMEVSPETHAFAMEIAKKHLDPEIVSDMKKNITVLEQLEERSLGYRRYNDELTPYEVEVSGYLARSCSVNADRLTIEEASDLATFINDGYNRFDKLDTREKRLEATQKSEEIKNKKVEFLKDAVQFAIEGVRQRRTFLPEIDRLMDKCSDQYKKSSSGYDLDEALEDDAINLPYIDEYGDRQYYYRDYDDDDYGYNYDQPINRDDKRSFYRGQLRERLEGIDSSDLADIVDADYKYQYGAFTGKDMSVLDDVSDLVYNNYIRKNRDVGLAEFTDEIAFAPVRGSTTEVNMVKLYAAEKYYPSRILSQNNLAQLAIAINREFDSGKINKDVSEARKVERAIDKVLSKQDINTPGFSSKVLSKEFDNIVESIIECVSNGELIIEDREEFYDQIETMLRSGRFRNGEEYIDEFERLLEGVSEEEIVDCFADIGISRAAHKLKVGIGHMNRYLNRLYKIQMNDDSSRPVDRDFIDRLAKKVNDSGLHNRPLDVWEIKDLSSVDYQIKRAENRFVLINALLKDSNQEETSVPPYKNVALLESALKDLEF